MIRIRAQQDGSDPLLSLIPRRGFKKNAKDLELKLEYGYTCPYCSNVILAMFYTSRQVSLWPYEETTILSQGTSNMGELLKIVPGLDDPKDHSAYESRFYPLGAQTIRLRSHTVLPSVIDRLAYQDTPAFRAPEELWETGSKPCPWAGVWSHSEDLAMKDFMVLYGIGSLHLASYRTPSIREILVAKTSSNNYGFLEGFGKCIPMIMVDRQALGAPINRSLLQLLSPYQLSQKEAQSICPV